MSNINGHGLKSPISTVITESTLIKTGCGRLRKIIVTSSKLDSATIEILDNVEDANPVLVRQFTAVSSTVYKFGDVTFETGLYIVVGGLINATVFYF